MHSIQKVGLWLVIFAVTIVIAAATTDEHNTLARWIGLLLAGWALLLGVGTLIIGSFFDRRP